MNETLVVSSRGQITLPASLRKRLGIKGGDVMILELGGSGYRALYSSRLAIEE